MNELRTLQEEGDKRFDEQYSVGGEWWKEAKIITPIMIKAFIQQERQKAFTLGIMKGVEEVLKELEDFEAIEWRDDEVDDSGVGYNKAVREIKDYITKLKQELK